MSNRAISVDSNWSSEKISLLQNNDPFQSPITRLPTLSTTQSANLTGKKYPTPEMKLKSVRTKNSKIKHIEFGLLKKKNFRKSFTKAHYRKCCQSCFGNKMCHLCLQPGFQSIIGFFMNRSFD